MMDRSDIEKIEVELLLEAIFRRYGYDFRCYARASIIRQLRQFIEKTGHACVSELIPKMLHDAALFQQLLLKLSVTVSSMFRDPSFYQVLRQDIVPLLKTYPFIRVWIAGCAAGEEAYSVAILLKEEGLLARATIYATDINERALAAAKEGIYPLSQVREYTENYQQSGPLDSFSSYYHAAHDRIVMNRDLKQSLTFAKHNLVSDYVFAEMHLILCRNVMIYFNQELKDRVLRLFDDSLIRGGFLCLGAKETLRFSSIDSRYREAEHGGKIYRKRFVAEKDPCPV
ncbi:Chemotaxis protein methyltransferase CheR [Candidatus Electronema halotolerans]